MLNIQLLKNKFEEEGLSRIIDTTIIFDDFNCGICLSIQGKDKYDSFTSYARIFIYCYDKEYQIKFSEYNRYNFNELDDYTYELLIYQIEEYILEELPNITKREGE